MVQRRATATNAEFCYRTGLRQHNLKVLLRSASKTAESREGSAGVPVFTIRPTNGWRFLDLRELWAYRELVYFLTWRDIKVRYKQTAIGVVWTVLQPLALMLVFTLFFGILAKMPSEGIPYPLFAYAALLPWQLFSRTIAESTNSLVTDQRLITRVYFPRIMVPTATILAAIVDFAVAAVLLVPLMLYYGVTPGLECQFPRPQSGPCQPLARQNIS